jgi:hypothetical protein
MKHILSRWLLIFLLIAGAFVGGTQIRLSERSIVEGASACDWVCDCGVCGCANNASGFAAACAKQASSGGGGGSSSSGGGSSSSKKCDGWADSGTEHRNAGNGCFYTCKNGSWSGPTKCDGQGNGQFQGETAKSEEERARQEEAVRERQQESEKKVEEQGAATTAQVAAQTADQRAREAARQQAMVEAQRQAAVAEAQAKGASQDVIDEANRRAQQASQQVSQAQGTSRGSEIVGSNELRAREIAAIGYDPNSPLALGTSSFSSLPQSSQVALSAAAINIANLNGACDVNTGSPNSVGAGAACCRGGVVECGSGTNGSCMSEIDRPGVVGYCGAVGQPDTSGFCGDNFCQATENAESCSRDCSVISEYGERLFSVQGGECIPCVPGSGNCVSLSACLVQAPPTTNLSTAALAQRQQALNQLYNRCYLDIDMVEGTLDPGCVSQISRIEEELRGQGDRGLEVIATVRNRVQVERNIYSNTGQAVAAQYACTSGTSCAQVAADLERARAQQQQMLQTIAPDRAEKVNQNRTQYRDGLVNAFNTRIEEANAQRDRIVAQVMQSARACNIDDVLCIQRLQQQAEQQLKSISAGSSFCRDYPNASTCKASVEEVKEQISRQVITQARYTIISGQCQACRVDQSCQYATIGDCRSALSIQQTQRITSPETQESVASCPSGSFETRDSCESLGGICATNSFGCWVEQDATEREPEAPQIPVAAPLVTLPPTCIDGTPLNSYTPSRMFFCNDRAEIVYNNQGGVPEERVLPPPEPAPENPTACYDGTPLNTVSSGGIFRCNAYGEMVFNDSVEAYLDAPQREPMPLDVFCNFSNKVYDAKFGACISKEQAGANAFNQLIQGINEVFRKPASNVLYQIYSDEGACRTAGWSECVTIVNGSTQQYLPSPNATYRDPNRVRAFMNSLVTSTLQPQWRGDVIALNEDQQLQKVEQARCHAANAGAGSVIWVNQDCYQLEEGNSATAARNEEARTDCVSDDRTSRALAGNWCISTPRQLESGSTSQEEASPSINFGDIVGEVSQMARVLNEVDSYNEQIKSLDTRRLVALLEGRTQEAAFLARDIQDLIDQRQLVIHQELGQGNISALTQAQLASRIQGSIQQTNNYINEQRIFFGERLVSEAQSAQEVQQSYQSIVNRLSEQSSNVSSYNRLREDLRDLESTAKGVCPAENVSDHCVNLRRTVESSREVIEAADRETAMRNRDTFLQTLNNWSPESKVLTSERLRVLYNSNQECRQAGWSECRTITQGNIPVYSPTNTAQYQDTNIIRRALTSTAKLFSPSSATEVTVQQHQLLPAVAGSCHAANGSSVTHILLDGSCYRTADTSFITSVNEQLEDSCRSDETFYRTKIGDKCLITVQGDSLRKALAADSETDEEVEGRTQRVRMGAADEVRTQREQARASAENARIQQDIAFIARWTNTIFTGVPVIQTAVGESFVAWLNFLTSRSVATGEEPSQFVYLNCLNPRREGVAYQGAQQSEEALCRHLVVERAGSTCTPERNASQGKIIICNGGRWENLSEFQQQELEAHERLHSELQDRPGRALHDYCYSQGINIDDTTHGSTSYTQRSCIGIAELGAQLVSYEGWGDDYGFVLAGPEGEPVSFQATTQEAINHLRRNCPGSSDEVILAGLVGDSDSYGQLVGDCSAPPHELIPDRYRHSSNMPETLDPELVQLAQQVYAQQKASISGTEVQNMRTLLLPSLPNLDSLFNLF